MSVGVGFFFFCLGDFCDFGDDGYLLFFSDTDMLAEKIAAEILDA